MAEIHLKALKMLRFVTNDLPKYSQKFLWNSPWSALTV